MFITRSEQPESRGVLRSERRPRRRSETGLGESSAGRNTPGPTCGSGPGGLGSGHAAFCSASSRDHSARRTSSSLAHAHLPTAPSDWFSLPVLGPERSTLKPALAFSKAAFVVFNPKLNESLGSLITGSHADVAPLKCGRSSTPVNFIPPCDLKVQGAEMNRISCQTWNKIFVMRHEIESLGKSEEETSRQQRGGRRGS